MNERFSLRCHETTATLAGCDVEISRDGSAVMFVDGERLFRFASLTALLSEYGLRCGDPVL